MVLVRGDGTVLVFTGLHPRVPLNPAGFEIGYWVPTAQTRKGWATLATRIATVYAFDKFGANRVQVMCDEENRASRRVIEKCGFELEGTLRNVTVQPSPELIAGGYRAARRSPLFALVPETFEGLPWVDEVRRALTYVNMAGFECRSSPRNSKQSNE